MHLEIGLLELDHRFNFQANQILCILEFSQSIVWLVIIGHDQSSYKKWHTDDADDTDFRGFKFRGLNPRSSALSVSSVFNCQLFIIGKYLSLELCLLAEIQ